MAGARGSGFAEGSDLDPDGIYRQIGIYVVSFQQLEDKLRQICWFLTEPPYSATGRRSLVKRSYSQLIDETGRRVYAFLCDREKEDTDFARGFHAHLSDCREIGRNRNRIVHSAYVHLEGGGELQAIVRSKMRKEKGGGDVEFDRQYLTEQSFDSELTRIAETVFALGIDLVQLIHWRGRSS